LRFRRRQGTLRRRQARYRRSLATQITLRLTNSQCRVRGARTGSNAKTLAHPGPPSALWEATGRLQNQTPAHCVRWEHSRSSEAPKTKASACRVPKAASEHKLGSPTSPKATTVQTVQSESRLRALEARSHVRQDSFARVVPEPAACTRTYDLLAFTAARALVTGASTTRSDPKATSDLQPPKPVRSSQILQTQLMHLQSQSVQAAPATTLRTVSENSPTEVSTRQADS